MVRAEARVHESDLLSLGIIYSKLAAATLEWKQNRRRLVTPLLAEGRIVAGANSLRNPDSALFIKHRIVHISLTVPDGIVAPIGGRRHNLVIGARWRLWVTNGQFHLACRGTSRIEDREVIRAKLRSSIDPAVGIDGGIPLVGRDLVMEICFRVGPIPLGDNDVPLDTLRPGRRRRQFPSGNSIRPICEQDRKSTRLNSSHLVIS